MEGPNNTSVEVSVPYFCHIILGQTFINEKIHTITLIENSMHNIEISTGGYSLSWVTCEQNWRNIMFSRLSIWQNIEGQMYNMIQSQKDKNYRRNNKHKERLIFTSVIIFIS